MWWYVRTRYHYDEFGCKVAKLLLWQIKKEDTERYIYSIKTDDGRYLENPKERNSEFQNYYQPLYTTDHDSDHNMSINSTKD